MRGQPDANEDFVDPHRCTFVECRARALWSRRELAAPQDALAVARPCAPKSIVEVELSPNARRAACHAAV